MGELEFIQKIEGWHFMLLWCQAWVFSLVIDFKLHKESWGLLMQVGFSAPNHTNRHFHNKFWTVSGEMMHNLLVYWLLVTVGYFLVFY